MKNSDSKHYTPDISEFHIGFSYQRKNRDFLTPIYQDYTIENEDELKVCVLIHDELRVKYLDREDIEEFGFVQIEYDTYKKENYYFEFNNQYKTFIYEKRAGMENTLFAGTIKNKSELRRLMVQLGISQ